MLLRREILQKGRGYSFQVGLQTNMYKHCTEKKGHLGK